MEPFYSAILRKVRRLAVSHGHILRRFRRVKDSAGSQIGIEFWSECKFCQSVVCVLPEYCFESHCYKAFISMCQCENRHRTSTFLIFGSREDSPKKRVNNKIVYRTKLGTMPYANVVSLRPLVVGERLWVPETTRFKPVRPRFTPNNASNLASCIVDRIDGDVLFLTRH